jgi:hypothetical protein
MSASGHVAVEDAGGPYSSSSSSTDQMRIARRDWLLPQTMASSLTCGGVVFSVWSHC